VTELERALLALEVEWPATPDLAAAVAARLEAEPARAGRVAAWWRRLTRRTRRAMIALASVLVVAGGTLAVSPAARSTVWRWLGLQGVEIRREKPTATAGPRSTLGTTLGLGTPIGIEQARKAGALFPAGLPEPAAAYLGPRVGGQRPVALVYPAKDGLKPSKVTGVALLVQTFRASVDEIILKKMSFAGDVELLRVAGAPAYWISGEPHGFQYTTPGGNGAFVPQRLADHTLLVERGGKLLRIEGAISKQRAIELATSAFG
jgi:hypothetical protein